MTKLTPLSWKALPPPEITGRSSPGTPPIQIGASALPVIPLAKAPPSYVPGRIRIAVPAVAAGALFVGALLLVGANRTARLARLREEVSF